MPHKKIFNENVVGRFSMLTYYKRLDRIYFVHEIYAYKYFGNKVNKRGVSSVEEVNKVVAIVQLMKKLTGKIKHEIGCHFKELNLTGPQGMLIGTLFHHGEMKVSELSEKLGLSNSTVSGILDRLEKQGLVERIRSKDDRRVVYINVTDEFKKQSKKQFEEISQIIEQMINKATPEELDKILEGMETLKTVVERQIE
jgi:DNA-binding MarR family transcriptional regulator